MKTTIRLLTLAALVLAAGSCNHRDSPFNTVTPSTSTPLSEPRPQVYSLTFESVSGYGPVTVKGTVVLTLPAPAGGVEVSLANSDPSLVSLPSSVAVPAGKDSVTFAGTTRPVSADHEVTVTAATAAGRSATATLSLWTVLPTSFSFWSEPGDYIGGGEVRRLAPPYERFVAECKGNRVHFEFSKDQNWWSADFQAPGGAPLRVGTYEGATRWPFQPSTAPGIYIGGEGRGCESAGRFTIREAEFSASGQVRRFWATFEQHCERFTAVLHGEIRVTNGPAVTGNSCMQ